MQMLAWQWSKRNVKKGNGKVESICCAGMSISYMPCIKGKRVQAYYLKPLNCINKCEYNPAQLEPNHTCMNIFSFA